MAPKTLGELESYERQRPIDKDQLRLQEIFRRRSMAAANNPADAANVLDIDRRLAGARNTTETVTGERIDSAQIDRTAINATRNDQTALGRMLAARAEGRAPSLTDLQHTRGTDAAIVGALANRNAPGAAGALAARMGALNQSTAGARMAETGQAVGGYAGHLAGVRGQDIGLATQQAQLDDQAAALNTGLDQQARLANQQATLAGQSIVDARRRALLGQRFQIGQNALNRNIEGNQIYMNRLMGQDMNAAQKAKVKEETDLQWLHAAANMATMGLAQMGRSASDKNLKTNVRSGRKYSQEFLDALSARDR